VRRQRAKPTEAREAQLRARWQREVQTPGSGFADLQRIRGRWLADARAAGHRYNEPFQLVVEAFRSTGDPSFEPAVTFLLKADLSGPSWVHRLPTADRGLARTSEPQDVSKRFATLVRIAEATASPDLGKGLVGLRAYGLEGNDWRQRCRRLRAEREDGEHLLAERIEARLRDQSLPPVSLRDASRELVVSMGIEAATFAAALRRAEDAAREYRRSREQGTAKYLLPPRQQALCDGFAGFVLVRANAGRRVVDPATREIVSGLWHVPAVRYWRQRIAAGDVRLMWPTPPRSPANFPAKDFWRA